MNKYDREYFFVLRPMGDERLPAMTADEDTARRRFGFTRIPVGSKPLVFHNGALDFQRDRGIKPTDPPPDILFCGSDVLIKDAPREALWPLDIPNLAIQPAIYIDHNNKWHENYWYLTFLELFDCWDREHSVFDPDPLTLGDESRFDVYQYSLDDALLDKIPLEQRRLFKMGGTLDGMVVVHVSLAKHFKGSGAVLVPIADYGVTFP